MNTAASAESTGIRRALALSVVASAAQGDV